MIFINKVSLAINKRINKIKEYTFLFQELVKRDFKKKYKRTVLGMLWSLLSPLLMLTVLALVFTNLYGKNIEHFIIYLFCGNLVYSYYSESTSMGMTSLLDNSQIFSKVNVPKYMFLLSKNVSSLINFGLTLIIFMLFVIIDGVPITWKFLLLIYPIICLIIFNLGLGLILSAAYVIFRDVKYLYDIFKMALMYFCAIFYSVSAFPENIQWMFRLNPVYVYIEYFRTIVLEARVPDLKLHLLAIGYAIVVLILGALLYHKQNYKFLYYI